MLVCNERHPLTYPLELSTTVYRSSEIAESELQIENRAFHPVTIAGAEVSYGCTTIYDLPIVLEPQETARLRITVDTKKMPEGLNLQRFRFFTGRYSETPCCKLNINVTHGHVVDENSTSNVLSSAFESSQ